MRRQSLAWASCTSLTLLGSLTLPGAGGSAQAQTANTSTLLPQVNVSAPAAAGAYALPPQFNTNDVTLGPLPSRPVLDTPASVTTVPQDLIVNLQTRTVNDTLRYLPSVEVRDQQGVEVSRPQSRGFQGSIVQNTRLDGLNIIGTTAIPTENLAAIQVLNGLGGPLFGPETPAGVFNYILKRPTDTPLYRVVESFDSSGAFTEEVDLGGRAGPDGKFGYRVDIVHGQGEQYVSQSELNRTLLSGDFDIHIDDRTVVELDLSHYSTNSTGLPGSFVYDSGKSTLLPSAVNPTRIGYGQPNAGPDLITDTGLMKIKHSFNDNWNIELGGLYQNAQRNLFGITNMFSDNGGDYSVTKNFNAVPHFTVGSNTASLNGHFDTFGLRNDLTVATNGFINGQYSYRNSISSLLGSANLDNPLVFATKPVPYNGGQYKSAELSEQSIITGDMIHFNEQWALQGVLNTSFISSDSYGVTGATTSTDSRNGAFSPTVNLIYKPTPRVTTYASFAQAVEQGDQAPTGTVNANQVLAPYQDREYELGAKYAVTDTLLVTLAGFRMTRPLAETSAATNVFAVVGTQRNYGAELFAQGNITPQLSVFGGVTYIDARTKNKNLAATNDKLVVGVPNFKTDVALDYHPAFAQGFALTGVVHGEGRRAATNTNNSYAPSYATFDVGTRYSLSYLNHYATARLQVINVTDAHYYASIADGNIVGSPGANTAYLGTPRTFLASLEVDF